MIDWEQYIKFNILEFRKRYEKLSKDYKELIKTSRRISPYPLTKPSQVVVIDFQEPYPKCVIVLHIDEYPDMKTIVFENVVFEEFFSKVLKEKPEWIELFGIERIKQIYNTIKRGKYETARKRSLSTYLSEFEESFYVIFDNLDAFTYSPSDTGFSQLILNAIDIMMGTELKILQRNIVKKTVDDLKKDVEAIPKNVELRNKIIENTQRLEGQIKELNERFEQEITGLHKLVGSSEGLLVLRTFSSDIEHLKETHVIKDVFETHIKRLDEKIDKGLEALNRRIEDLKAIKFWSKRTLLEIALGIWGAIVTLYVAGILKF